MTRGTRAAVTLAVSLSLVSIIGSVFATLQAFNCHRDRKQYDADAREREQRVYDGVDERVRHMETRWDLTYSMAKKAEFQIDDLWMWHKESQTVDNMLKEKTEYLDYFMNELNSAFQDRK